MKRAFLAVLVLMCVCACVCSEGDAAQPDPVAKIAAVDIPWWILADDSLDFKVVWEVANYPETAPDWIEIRLFVNKDLRSTYTRTGVLGCILNSKVYVEPWVVNVKVLVEVQAFGPDGKPTPTKRARFRVR